MAAYCIVTLVWTVGARFSDDLGHGTAGDALPEEEGEEPTMNPDIGGIGVRSAYSIAGFTTIIATLLCHFSKKPSGIKELGVTQLFGVSFNALYPPHEYRS